MGNLSRSDYSIIQDFTVQTWAGPPRDEVYRLVLSPQESLPKEFTIGINQPVPTGETFRYFARDLSNLLRPTPFSLETDRAATSVTLYSSSQVLWVEVGEEDHTLLRRISGAYGNPMGIGIYERKISRRQGISEALYLFGLIPKDEHTLAGHFVGEINEIMSGEPHDMQVTYKERFAWVEARNRPREKFRLDQPRTKLENSS